MRVRVDLDVCDANGLCVIEAPEVFELDDDDNLTLLMDEPPEELRAKVRSAEALCPTRAIEVED
jgi:ferredoxin